MLLIVSYQMLFFGYPQSTAVVVLFCIFGSLSRSISDWVLLLRVRKSFPKSKLVVLVGVTILVARFGMEVTGRTLYNLGIINDNQTAFLLNPTAVIPPTYLIRIYPWFNVAMDGFFTLMFTYRFYQKLQQQRAEDHNISRAERWFHSWKLITREQHILPAVGSTIIAIIQSVSLDPNRYASIGLLVTVLTTPFATVWRALEKKFASGDPAATLMPLAQDIAQDVGRPMQNMDEKTSAAPASTPAKLEQGQAGQDKVFQQVLGLSAAVDAKSEKQLAQAASLATGGVIGGNTTSNANSQKGTTTNSSTKTPVTSPPPSKTTTTTTTTAPPSSTGKPVVNLADKIETDSDKLAFNVIKAAADTTTRIEQSKLAKKVDSAASSVSGAVDQSVAKVKSNVSLPTKAPKAKPPAESSKSTTSATPIKLVSSDNASGEMAKPPSTATGKLSSQTSPQTQQQPGRMLQVVESIEHAGETVSNFIDRVASEEEQLSGKPVPVKK